MQHYERGRASRTSGQAGLRTLRFGCTRCVRIQSDILPGLDEVYRGSDATCQRKTSHMRHFLLFKTYKP